MKPSRADARDRLLADGRPRWSALERLLQPGPLEGTEWSALAKHYRAVCGDLSRARSGELGDDLVHYLDALAARAHHRLYARRPRAGAGLGRLLLTEIPCAIRENWAYVALAAALFYVPLVFATVGAWADSGFALAVLSEAQLENMEQMYADNGPARTAGEDVRMAGFYVRNNVGIALQCFATGLFLGLGPVFYLIYNGMVLGTVSGWLGAAGLGHNLLAFVSGHAAWELNGIVLAGAGGFRMGHALVETGGQSRGESLAAASAVLYRLVAGAAVMLLVAAAIEGFWSSLALPMAVKLVFGAGQWVTVLVWWFGSGRGPR